MYKDDPNIFYIYVDESSKSDTYFVVGARDEFHLAAIVQNLKTMALRLLRPPSTTPEPSCV
jgi:hypothetical protein